MINKRQIDKRYTTVSTGKEVFFLYCSYTIVTVILMIAKVLQREDRTVYHYYSYETRIIIAALIGH